MTTTECETYLVAGLSFATMDRELVHHVLTNIGVQGVMEYMDGNERWIEVSFDDSSSKRFQDPRPVEPKHHHLILKERGEQ